MNTSPLPVAEAEPPAFPEGDPRTRLDAWPEVRAQLAERGVDLELQPSETLDAWENRIGTRLMALFRDTRSSEAFEALYCFARPALLQWIRSLLHRGLARLDPVELLQDTFINVFRYPGGFREDHRGSFRVWVRTIAGNIVRRASAPPSRFSFQELPEGLQEPQDLRENPLRHAAEDEQRDGLRTAWIIFLSHYANAWSELSERDRLALQLVEVKGLTYEEAGQILRVRRSNMKMIVFRSRKRIARRMRVAMQGGGVPELQATSAA
jgi:RNA polymerase sigma factor (sigma-70 family)